MALTRLEEFGNFLLITDVSSGTETRFPRKDTYYAFEDKNKVLVLTWAVEGEDIVHRYLITDTINNVSTVFTKSSLDSFLASILGFNGGGTSPTPGYRILKALVTYTGYGQMPIFDILEDTLTPTIPSLNISDSSGGSGSYYIFESNTEAFPTKKTLITVGNNHSSSGIIAVGSAYNHDGGKIDLLLTQAPTNTSSIEYFYQTPIEIKVYD